MFTEDEFLNLSVFRLDPGVIHVTVGVKSRQGLQALFLAAMVDKPTRGLVTCTR
jgi:hypothetical protein